MTRAFLLAGESSGDLQGALLARELLARQPDLEIYGVGGERMAAEGVRLIRSSSTLSVVGFSEVVSMLPRLLQALREVRRAIDELQPDVFVPIDYPDFNFRLLRHVHARRIPIAYYISPQVWAWRAGRIEVLKRYVDRVIVIFPFEEPIYRERGVPVTWVGHPLVDRVPEELDAWRREVRQRIGIREGHTARSSQGFSGPTRSQQPSANSARLSTDAEESAPENECFDDSAGSSRAVDADATVGPAIALLPGSRRSEIRRIAPLLQQVREQIDAGAPGVQWIIGQADAIDRELLAEIAPGAILCPGMEALAAADLAIVASGTATLESLLVGTPSIVVYRTSALTYEIARRLVKVPHIAMANLVAGERVLPELIQDEADPKQIARQALEWIRDPSQREAVRSKLLAARERLGPRGAAGRAAEAVLEVAR
jgi:lipid-A-disaccharide synthase